MDWNEIIYMVVAALGTFIIGLIRNKPGYKKSIETMEEIIKAANDGKVTKQEVEHIFEIWKNDHKAAKTMVDEKSKL